jgi:hypothetical protein
MTDYQEVELVEDLPEGSYHAAIISVPEVEEFGEEGWEYFKAPFQITSGEHEGRTVMYSAPFHQQATRKSRLGKLLRALFPEQKSGKFKFEEMLQKPCEIVCEDDDDDFLKITKVRLLGPDEKPY